MAFKDTFKDSEEYNDFMYKVDAEGFDYAFVSYSNWDGIQDEKFQELRKAYVAAQKALYDYIDVDGWNDSLSEEFDDEEEDGWC